MICREEADRLIACFRSSALKETGIGVEVKLDRIAKNNEGIRAGIGNQVPIISTGTPHPDAQRRRGGQICTKAGHEQKKSSGSGWVGGGSGIIGESIPATLWQAGASEDDDREVVKSSPIDIAKAYMKERGTKLRCQLPPHVAIRGRDNMFGDKVTRTPPVDNIRIARKGISFGPRSNPYIVGFPISREGSTKRGLSTLGDGGLYSSGGPVHRQRARSSLYMTPSPTHALQRTKTTFSMCPPPRTLQTPIVGKQKQIGTWSRGGDT